MTLSDFVSVENLKGLGGTAANIITAARAPKASQVLAAANTNAPAAAAPAPAKGYTVSEKKPWVKWVLIGLGAVALVAGLFYVIKQAD